MSISIRITDPSCQTRAQQLAEQLSLPISDTDDVDYQLLVSARGLELKSQNYNFQPLYIDFVNGKEAYRRQHGGGRQQLIARAVGLHKHKQLTMIDATAGLGRDAFVFASLGADVTMIEANPVIAALLNDGLTRLLSQQQYQLSLFAANAIDFLKALPTENKPDVIYLDPMYVDQHDRLVKKEMRMLRDIVGDDDNTAELFDIARQVAKKRVVIKRAKKAAPIAGINPDLQLAGRSTRFDIYLNTY